MCDPFLSIATHLHAQGLTVPEILDADPENGLILEGRFWG